MLSSDGSVVKTDVVAMETATVFKMILFVVNGLVKIGVHAHIDCSDAVDDSATAATIGSMFMVIKFSVCIFLIV